MSDAAQLVIDRTQEIAHIPAPTFAERDRADRIRDWWIRDGLTNVATDDTGNLLVQLRGGSAGAPGAILVCAHMDTVFAADVAHTTRWDGDRLIGPSVGDDSVALAALSVLEASLPPSTQLPVWIAATVAEEGLGNLAGITQVLDTFPAPLAGVIALEGNYLGRVNVTGVGSVRGRVDVSGPGGHSWEEPGNPSAVELSVECIAGILRDFRPIQDSSPAKGTVNVGRIAGGESVNSRALACTFYIEARSENPNLLAALEDVTHRNVDNLAKHIDATWTDLGRRPAGGIDQEHPLARISATALERQGLTPTFSAASTDANAAYARGIPAVTLGVAFGGATHTEHEWIDARSVGRGIDALRDTVERLAEGGW
jgi:tripeptide aminopeptidase